MWIRGKDLALVGGNADRLFRGANVGLEEQVCRLPTALQNIPHAQERAPIGHEDRIMKRSLKPASPRMTSTELVDLRIAAAEWQRLGHRKR